MPIVGAAKVMTANGPVWCHFSRTARTVKLRRFVDGVAYEFDADPDDIEEEYSQSQCEEIVPGQGSYAFSETGLWTRILKALESGAAKPAQKVSNESTPQLVVPVTRLRRYYSSMKVFDKALFANLAKFYRDNPDSLESLWNDSRKQFEKYKNPDGWEEGKRKKLPTTKLDLADVNSTTQFASYFKCYGLATSGFTFVQRELNPWRTRQGKFSTNEPATKTGRGGIDLLLRSADGIPVIGEVKVKNDKNAFFALLQAMTYAVELSTSHQMDRLVRQYPEHFGAHLAKKPSVEIAVIKVNPEANDLTLAPVVELIEKLNQEPKCTGLGHIKLFQNDKGRWSVYS